MRRPHLHDAHGDARGGDGSRALELSGEAAAHLVRVRARARDRVRVRGRGRVRGRDRDRVRDGDRVRVRVRDRDRVRVRDRDRVKKSLAARPPLTSCVATLDEMPAAPEEPADPRGNESSRLPGWSTASDSATLGRH